MSFRTLLTKEMLRFWKVSFQTVGAPVLTAVLYLLVFGHVLEEHVQALPGVSYTAFLIPGPGDDVGAAERVCEFVIEPDPVENHGQPDLHTAAAVFALATVRRVCGGLGRAWR